LVVLLLKSICGILILEIKAKCQTLKAQPTYSRQINKEAFGNSNSRGGITGNCWFLAAVVSLPH
jgi:hypothetical protein